MNSNTTCQAIAVDNRATRLAALLDTARPFVAVKPKGYLNPVIGHYGTVRAAQRAAKRFNDAIAKES